MKNRGVWEAYVPDEIPFGTPANTLFWKRQADNADLYAWSRLFFEFEAGADTSGTTKVVVVGGFAACISDDISMLSLPPVFTLIEIEPDEVVPQLGWALVDGVFAAPAVPTPPITRRQLRLTLVRNGIALSTVESAIEAMPEGLEKAEAQIEWADASEFERSHPTLLLIASALGLSEAQVDTMWLEAAVA